MARQLTVIEEELETNVNNVFDRPSVSKVAEWKVWKSIFAAAIWAFEKILDLFKTEVENIITQKQPGTIDWYYDKVKAFQGADDGNGFHADDLVLDESGILRYQVENESRRIIAKASLTDIEGVLAIKVAKQTGTNELGALSSIELNAFSTYMRNIKYPGTEMFITSLQPDLIRYDVNIYYNPVLSESTIQANVLAKLEEFKSSMGFDDKLFQQKLIDYLMNADGVVSVKMNNLYRKASTDTEFVLIDVVYELAAGYFNYQLLDAASEPSVMNLINVNTIF